MKNTIRVQKTLLGMMLLSFSLIAPKAHSQQDPLYALYINNPFVINPAYAGINDNLTVFASYRNQWAGFQGSPTTMNAGGHISLWQNKIGAGLMAVSDKLGENTNTQLTGSFAYKLPITEGTTLAFGMQAGFINYKVDPSQLTVQDPSDPYFAPINQTKPIIGAGVILKGEKYMLGLSVPRLVNSSFNLGGQKVNMYQQHFYVLGSYLFFLSERIVLKPSVLLKAVSGSPLSTDLNFNLIINRNYTAGVFTRNFNTYGALVQLAFLEKYRVAYAIELPTNQSVGAHFSTHEIMLSVRMAVLNFHKTSQSNF